MSDEQKTVQHTTPSVTAHTGTFAGKPIPYRAESGWTKLYKREKADAELFSVFYETEAEDPSRRPLTFVFNGGPGAASAYLHVGAIGPRRVVFGPTGNPPPPPVTLVENSDSWLGFTDLVFIDPIGTGFSRVLEDDTSKDDKESKSEDKSLEKSKEYWKITRDLESLALFVTSFVSTHHRWDSPIFIAGESYGGFRGAKLARLLQESYGVGLNGVILISPALEFSLLDQSDYDVLPWIDRVPSMTAAALHHGKSTYRHTDTKPAAVLSDAEGFATGGLVELLLRGSKLTDARRKKIVRDLARMIGLAEPEVDAMSGRVPATRFVRSLLRDQGLICGLYDATITCPDAFPARETYEGPDPTLRSIERIFASGINKQLRQTLAVDTERQYHLLSMEVNKNWQVDIERHALESQIGATDDLRYGMSLNPHMKVRITHGIYDLVTPYFASNRIADQLYLNGDLAANLSLKHYPGGHMFYAWEDSRQEFARDMEAFYLEAQPDLT